jgi:hypothetical protein
LIDPIFVPADKSHGLFLCQLHYHPCDFIHTRSCLWRNTFLYSHPHRWGIRMFWDMSWEFVAGGERIARLSFLDVGPDPWHFSEDLWSVGGKWCSEYGLSVGIRADK